jgi:translation initiation factor 2D
VKDNIQTFKLAEPVANAVVYSNGDEPYFVDMNGKGQLYPTLYTIWRCPACLPALAIQAPVSKFVVKGSDLMLPGVAFGIDGGPFAAPEDMPEFQQGSGMLVFCIGNPMPIAVGEMLISKQEAIASGMKGKACKVRHALQGPAWFVSYWKLAFDVSMAAR